MKPNDAVCFQNTMNMDVTTEIHLKIQVSSLL